MWCLQVGVIVDDELLMNGKRVVVVMLTRVDVDIDVFVRNKRGLQDKQ